MTKLNVHIKEEVESVDEVLDMAQRLKRSRSFKRNKAKVAVGQRRSKKRMANMDTLRRRARRSARKILLAKLTKGVPREDLSYARKAELEKRLDSPAMKSRINKLAMRSLKDVRKREIDRHKSKQEK
jgi:hypothetical protein